MIMKVPGQGFVGAGQQTMAAQLIIGGGMRNGSTGRKRRKSARKSAKRKSSPKRKRSARSMKRPARLVKGSAAAKRYMASIRKKRRRK